MSGSFEKRGKGFEAKWAHDEELRFKVAARRNKLLGLWAAGEMGLSGEDAATYAKSVVSVELQAVGVENVFRKIHADFEAAKLAHSDHAIRRKMEELLAEAADQIMHEHKS